MTRSRFLGSSNSATNNSELKQTSVNSDLIVILTALLCALICILGLVAVARCAWMRRLSSNPSPNKGLNKKALSSLPRQKYPHADGPHRLTECAICLMEFAEGEDIRLLPQCGHGFHLGCIDKWLASHSSCPSCRRILVLPRCQNCGAGAGTVSASPVPSFLP